MSDFDAELHRRCCRTLRDNDRPVVAMTQSIDLSVQEQETVRKLLARFLPNTETWVYGSRVRWTSRPESDLDMVVFTTPEQAGAVSKLREAFDESDLTFRVDLFVWDNVPQEFRREIVREHIVFSNGCKHDESTKSWLYNPKFPVHWERIPLYDMAQWKNGLAFRDIEFSPTGKPVIKIAEIKGGISGKTKFTHNVFDESVRVSPGDLLFSWSGQPETSIDAFWWRGPEGWLNQHVFRVTPVENLDTTFFFYLLRHLKPNFIAIARNKQTTGLGHVTKRDLERIEAAAPPLVEQRAITLILGALDDRIELNRCINETLEVMARAIFKDWFVDFGPTRAKAEGRDPYLPQELWKLFPDTLDNENKPMGWRVVSLTELAKVNPESWSKKNAPHEVEYVDLASTKWGAIEATQRFLWEEAPSRAKRILRPGDTIVGLVRPANGSYSFVSSAGLTGSTGFAVLRPRHSRYTPLVLLSATAPENIERLAILADGAAYPAVRPEVVGATQIVVPDDAVATRFSELVSPIINQMESNKRNNHMLAQSRDLLLPRLFSGELRVPGAECPAAEAT
ncbi:MAG: hypothetical protein F4Z71_06140 [Gammaproteobacteria bacterium]|nr:hypothetical protein [Gammaproteobacteria bacterium]MYE30369.1 hypothetical protein [Gammaproteobacteria bacterium]